MSTQLVDRKHNYVAGQGGKQAAGRTEAQGRKRESRELPTMLLWRSGPIENKL